MEERRPISATADVSECSTRTPTSDRHKNVQVSSENVCRNTSMHDDGFFLCSQCEKTFGNERGLRMHVSRIHKCHNTTASQPCVLINVSSHLPLFPSHNQNTGNDSTSNVSNRSSSSLLNRYRECHICQKTFRNKRGLQMHVNRVHSSSLHHSQKSTLHNISLNEKILSEHITSTADNFSDALSVNVTHN